MKRLIQLSGGQQQRLAIAREGAFDLAISMFTSFGYFDDEGDDRRVLRNVFESLRPGGAFVVDVKSRVFHFHHTVYSGRELKDRMQDAGFSDVRLYGSFKGEDYGVDSPRLVAVERKLS